MYSNKWWERNYKLAFMRIKKVVENVAIDAFEIQENLWESTLFKYKKYNKGLISKGKPSPRD